MTDAPATSAIDLQHLLLLLQHGDGQFPSGAFGFSWGLEGMLADGMVRPDGLQAAIGSLLAERWAPFDRLVVRRAWRAGGDADRLAALDAEVEACLLVPAERSGSARAGAALLASHARLANPAAAPLRAAIQAGDMKGHRPVVEGALWRGLGLAEQEALLLSGYGFTAALCTAAVRLGRLGALGQQAILTALLPRLAELAAAPGDDDAVLESFNPLAEIAMLRQPGRSASLFAT